MAGNSTEFTGPDLKLQWSHSSQYYSPEFGAEDLGADEGANDNFFKDYEVRFYDTPESEGGTKLRTFHTLDNFFNLTYAKNVDLPGGPYRTITVQVYQRGRQNQLSSVPAVLTASNPPPAVPVITKQQAGFRSVFIGIGPVSDADFAGARVWGSTSQGFTPGDGNLLYDGRTEDGIAIGGLLPATTYYFRLAAFDLFGKTGLLTSAEFDITTLQAGETDIQDDAITADKIVANSITADKYNEIRNTILLSINDSLDASNPLIIDFPLMSELVAIEAVTLSYKLQNFRAYATTAASGGTATSDSGGSSTPTSTNEAVPTHSHTFSIANSAGTGTGIFRSTEGGFTTTSGSQVTLTSSTADGHTHTLTVVTGGVGTGVQTTSGTSSNGGNTTGHVITTNTTNSHVHEIIMVDPSGVKVPVYTTASGLQSNGGGQLQTGPAPGQHTHDVSISSHTHTIADHTHNLNFAIQEDNQSPTVTVKAANDGTTFGSNLINSSSDQLEVDITSSFSGAGWKAIKFETDANVRINGVLELKLDITA